jgi:hypothetical protein
VFSSASAVVGGGGWAGKEGGRGAVGLDLWGAAAGGLGVEVYAMSLGCVLWAKKIIAGAYWSCGIRDLLGDRCGLGRPAML